MSATETAPTTTPDDGLVIRLADPAEYAAIGELSYAAYRNDYTISDGYRAQLLDTAGRTDEYEIWVAADADGTLVGTVSILRDGYHLGGALRDGELYFRLLAVSPDARRRGIGARLTAFTLDEARRRGYRAVALNSGEHMTGAHALYTSLGFAADPERDIHIHDDGQAITVHLFTRAV
ncbi:GNAT family N-acetyltransferase [Leifsonia naganoensis]|uniref:GNAT superfamily N-acetyltransferase n=1 Tax=Leifsonia naganoensis TaxID=150025 RepID=A0A853DQ25_9MICO|nr:GNAT family N-acetyltransferase [Leifsonia naganoensis]NYK10367.1 GNAT superfamily N-acetyltransferase [Leifsonia naganoensis]